MTATPHHLVIEQGATLSQVVALGAAYNGLTPTAQIRKDPVSPYLGGAVLVDLTCSVVSGGNTTISLTADQTASLPYDIDRTAGINQVLGRWDLQTNNGGTVVRHRQGQAFLILGGTV